MIRAAGLVGILSVLLLGACAPAEPFPGGRTLDLACVKENRAPTDAELEALVAAVVQTYVGERDPAALDLMLELDAYNRRADQNMTNRARARVALASGGRFRFESESRAVVNVLMRDGADAWSILQDVDPAHAVGDPATPILWFDKALYPLRYLRGPEVVLRGLPPREVEGRVLVPVVCRDAHDPVVTLLIDPEGPLIVAAEATLPVTALVRQVAVTEKVRFEYEDHRREGGVLVPFKLRAFSQGTVAQVLDLIQVTLDPDLEGIAFRAD